MDIKIEKKPWYIRYRYYMIAALAFIIFLIYVISLSLGPRKLRIETDNIQIAEVKNDKFMEYVDLEGKGYDPRKLLKPGAEAIQATVKEKMELFGSVGKAE